MPAFNNKTCLLAEYMSSFSTTRHVFLFNKKTCLLVNKKTCPLAAQEDARGSGQGCAPHICICICTCGTRTRGVGMCTGYVYVCTYILIFPEYCGTIDLVRNPMVRAWLARPPHRLPLQDIYKNTQDIYKNIYIYIYIYI